MDDAAARKKAFAAEMEEKTRRFDQTADEETEKKLQRPRREMESRRHRLRRSLCGWKKIMSFTMKLM